MQKVKKAQGTSYFEIGQYAWAARRYDRAIYVAPKKTDFGVATKECGMSAETRQALEAESNKVKLGCYLNAALCQLKLDDGKRAVAAADEALKIEPASAKAVYRRAQGRFICGELEEAKADCLKAAKLDPKSRDIRTTLAAITAALKDQKEQNKKVWSKAFTGPAGKAGGGGGGDGGGGGGGENGGGGADDDAPVPID